MQTQASPVLVPNAVLLLTGYYDFACTAENTLRTLAGHEGVGHFR